MFHRSLPANATLIDRWGWLLFWLFEGMALDWRRRGLRHVHEGEIHQRILGLWKRLRSVLERSVLEQYRAGTLRAARGRDASVARPPHAIFPLRSAERAGGRCCRGGVLPRRFGWVKSLLLPESQHCVNAFNWLLYDNDEMKAAIAVAPAQIGRVLRPFCHFLGVEVPAELRLPKRRRVTRSHPSRRPTGSSPHRR